MTQMKPLLDRLRTFDTRSAAIATSARRRAPPRPERLRTRTGEAKAALRDFEKLGFKGEGGDNDPRGTVSVGEVRYAKGQEAAAKLVLTYVSPAARLVQDGSLDGTAADVVVVLGTDFDHIAVPSAGAGTTNSPTASTTPPTTQRGTTATTASGTATANGSGSGATTDPAAACR